MYETKILEKNSAVIRFRYITRVVIPSYKSLIQNMNVLFVIINF